MRQVTNDLHHYFREMEKLGIVQTLRKKYDDEAIAEAVAFFTLERTRIPKTRKAFLEMKRLAEYYI